MRRDLILVVALACLAFVAALLWLRAPLLVPLVLALPGYALAAILFPLRTISPAERGVYTVGLSIAVAAIGGLVIQLVIGLNREIWAAFLAAVTIAAAVRGLRRGERGWTAPSPARMPRSIPVAVVIFLTAAVVTAMAIASAGEGLREAQAKIRFTDFWLLPGSGSAERLTVGLRSHEGKRAHYSLRLSRDGLPFATQRLTLRAGDRWEQSFAIASTPSGSPVRAILSREGRPYRTLDFTPPK
jgi:uncharacterized membrane protein